MFFFRRIGLRIRTTGIVFILVIGTVMPSKSQRLFPLYDGGIPNGRPAPDKEQREMREGGILWISQISIPTIEVFVPETAAHAGTGIIIFPGGGYYGCAYGHEGTEVARAFNQMGITAFVVKYRTPDSATMLQPHLGPIQDAQRAIQWVRQRAAQYGIKLNRIGVMGFSAGGHLAATAGTHFGHNYLPGEPGVSLRPDFMILGYPVISFTKSFAHSGSAHKLLGNNPPADLLAAFSAEVQVTADTPPTFLLHTTEDSGVPPENSLAFYQALRRFQIPAELHLYEKGRHGVGLHLPNKNEQWITRCQHWLESHGWLPAR